MYASYSRTRALAQNLALSLDRERRPVIVEAISHLTRAFRLLSEEGASPVDLLDGVGGALDMISNLDADLAKGLDDVGLHCDPLDTTELRAIHDRVADKVGGRP